MNKKFLKRVAAFAMAATLVLGNAAVAFADEGAANGTGSNEGAKPEYPVDSIELPVVPDSSVYDYIVDPNALIMGTMNAGADNQHYDWSDFTSGQTLFFKTFVSGATPKYSNTSDPLLFANKSANDITIKAKVVGADSYTGTVKFVTGNFTAAGGQEIKIAAKGAYQNVKADGSGLDTAVPVSPEYVNGLGDSNAAKLTFDLAGNKDGYELVYDKNKSKYKYQMVSGASLWASGSFVLTGETNTANADTIWDNTAVPKLKVTWSWEPKVNPLNLSGTFDSTNNVFKISLPDGVNVSAAGDVSSVTADGHAITTGISINDAGTVIKITKAAVKAAEGDAWSWSSVSKVVFAFTVNSTAYGSTVKK